MSLYTSYKPIPSSAELMNSPAADVNAAGEAFFFEGNLEDEYIGRSGTSAYLIQAGFYENFLDGNEFLAVRYGQQLRLQIDSEADLEEWEEITEVKKCIIT